MPQCSGALVEYSVNAKIHGTVKVRSRPVLWGHMLRKRDAHIAGSYAPAAGIGAGDGLEPRTGGEPLIYVHKARAIWQHSWSSEERSSARMPRFSCHEKIALSRIPASVAGSTRLRAGTSLRFSGRFGGR